MTRFATSRDFREHVMREAISLPPQQRAIADYLLHNLHEVPFLAVPELAKLTHVSEATIVRCAQSLGFRGYYELKMELLQLPSEGEPRASLDEEPSGEAHHKVLRSVANLEVDNILATLELVDVSTFEQLADALHVASHVYVFGMGVSARLADLARYILTVVGVRCTALTTDFTSPTEQLFALGARDLLIAFSFHPYSRQTLDMLRGAKERDTATAVITDGLMSPAAEYATWILTVQTHNMMFTNAVASVIVLLNALATEYAIRHRARSGEAFAYVSRMMGSNPDVLPPTNGSRSRE